MICIVGVGKMGSAIAEGLLAAGHTQLTLVDLHTNELTRRFPDVATSSEPVACDGVIVSVKPKDVEVVTARAVAAGARSVLSIAAGITLARLQDAAGGGVPVFRVMPNLGALHRLSASAYCSHATATNAIEWAEEVISAFGSVTRVEEEHMDAVTGLSGSGPAYVFLMTEALIDAGVAAGLPPDVARRLSVSTMQGAAALLDDETPQKLREMVTTPNGTTARGIARLEAHDLRSAVTDAVAAAASRSRELGAPLS